MRVYQLARELGVDSREILRCARVLGLEIASPLAGVSSSDAERIRSVLQSRSPESIRVHELARELGVESRDVLEAAGSLGCRCRVSLAGVSPSDAERIRSVLQSRSPESIRVHELARELGVESRDVLEAAGSLDVTSGVSPCRRVSQ